ncbi:hypothetical protein G3N70_13430 [Xanthomonas hortorum pv. gardneri]|uniref:hypothetical protein n=1 Tax=Xanthomonas hortorum TaxID=56454 RepID=UPI002FE224F7
MPFNQLLLPLIGGYFLIAFTHISSHWASRQSKEQLILASAATGFISLISARIFAVLLAKTDLGVAAYKALHDAAPYQGIGTALLSVLACLFVNLWVNYVWPKDEASLWLYSTTGTYNTLEKLLLTSALRVRNTTARPFIPELVIRLFLHQPLNFWYYWSRRVKSLFRKTALPSITNKRITKVNDPLPVMLSMKDRKVYVGYIEWVPPLRADSSPYITIVPVWSGYRDPDSLKVFPTEKYEESFFNAERPNGKVIAIGDIANASLYDPKTFASFSDAATQPENETDKVNQTASHKEIPNLWERLRRSLLDRFRG